MQSPNKRSIQLLPEHIIDQIKAGEVIERPSTLIKEIIENAIDAESKNIDLHLVENGIELISIKDDGIGIAGDDLPLAFCRHATSKIDQFDDIYKLHSYGFRGEALASISAISKLTCQTNNLKESSLIKIEGGETITHQIDKSESSQRGTKIFIKDLFYNTPVRLKFIQSKTSEKNQLTKMINAFLLTHPHIRFSLKWDENEKEIFQSTQEDKRIKDVLFKKKSQNSELIHTEVDYDGVKLTLYLSLDSNRGNAHKHHYLFINNRYVQDISLHKIILNSAKGIWPEGETGHYIAFLGLPPDEIDVNIHPNKTVVKLFRAPKVYSVISGSVRQLGHKKHANETLNKYETEKAIQSQGKFSLEESRLESGVIQYKQTSFSDESDLSNYFADLHHGPQTESQINNEFKEYFSIGKFLIFNKNNKTYLLNKEKLSAKEFLEAIKSHHQIEDGIPLLVSKPIKILKKLPPKVEQFLESLGYEFDFLTKETLVIRSFSEKLQNFPYVKLFQKIVDEEFSSVMDLNLKNIPKVETQEFSYFKKLDELNLVNLLNEKIIIELKESHLTSLYE